MSRIAVPFIVLLFPVLSVAQNNNYVPDPNWKVPANVAATHNPVKSSPEVIQHARTIFESQCSMCHGSDGRGLANAANFHVPAVQAQSDGVLFWRITNGNATKGMPAFKSLSDKDRWSLVDYLRTFKSNKQ